MRFKLLIVLFYALFSCKTSSELASTSKSAEYTKSFHEGLRLKLLGNYEEALDSFRRCIKEEPEDDASHFAMAQIYLMKGNEIEAKKHTIEAATKDEDNIFYRIELAYMYREFNDFETSAEIFEQLISERPSSSKYYIEASSSWYQGRNLQRAIQVLNRLDDALGISIETCLKKHHWYMELGNHKEAEKELEKSNNKAPDNQYVIASFVDFYFRTGQTDKAISKLKTLVELNPKNGKGLILLGEYAYDNDDTEKAKDYFLRAIRSESLNAPETIKSLQFLIYHKDNLPIEEGLANAEKSYLNNDTVMEFIGDYYMEIQDFEKALLIYENTLEANPNSYRIWEKVLNVHYDNQQWNSLISKAEKSIKIFPLKTIPYYMLSVAYNQTKQYRLANQAAQEGIDMIGLVAPGKNKIIEADLLGQLGESNFGLNQYEEAKGNYLQAIKEVLSGEENEYLKFNFCFRLYEHNKELDLAIEILNEMLLTNKTDNFDLLFLKGDIYFKKENFKEAMDIFDKLNMDYKEHPLVYERIGDVKAKLNNLKEALEYWKEAQKLGSTNAILQKKIDSEAYFE